MLLPYDQGYVPRMDAYSTPLSCCQPTLDIASVRPMSDAPYQFRTANSRNWAKPDSLLRRQLHPARGQLL